MAASKERLDAIFKAYDIRGLVPEQMDADLVREIGAAFARFAQAEGGPVDRILVARDMRPSGVELAEAFAQGVTQAGTDVVDLGLCSTDELFFASGHFGAPGAQLTASHNPAAYNGIKLCLAGARPVGVDSGLSEIRSAVAAGVPRAEVHGSISRDNALEPFVRHVHSFVDRSQLCPLRIVADTANGMGGLVAPAVFEGLPFEVEILYGELDGTFPNHEANPIDPANLVDLIERVRATGADVGLAFDGDADRVFLVDDTGEALPGSTTTAIVAVETLRQNPGSVILHNVICSKAVPEMISEHGGTPVRTRVGHSYIKAVMSETGAAFGGEHSGHYYFRDNYRADSGMIAALVVLGVLCRAGKPLSQLRRSYERYTPSGEINTEVRDPAAVVAAVAAEVESLWPTASSDHLDGLTVDLGSWWFNLRPSNTEPLLRLNVEAADEQACAERTAEVVEVIRRMEATLAVGSQPGTG